ncbi:MAG: hypothetical protein A2020_02745 [Lentisphaerae bacterium GWF2_45_14]|nr:MAG: hypothetical protein A2020_02745 [Lentisphaerae bacterium GWF2_45_14]
MCKSLKFIFCVLALSISLPAHANWRDHFEVARPQGIDLYKSLNDESFTFCGTETFPDRPDFKAYILIKDVSAKYAESFDRNELYLDNVRFLDNTFVFSSISAYSTGFDKTEYSAVAVFPMDENSVLILYDRDLTLELDITDPIEGFNRVMYGINDFMMLYIIRPVNWCYASICPRYMIVGFKRMCDNFEFIVKGGSCLLQARFGDAGIVGLRFLINITAGVVGFYDPAYDWFGMQDYREDFGLAFASWGIGHGFYIVLPFMGPTSIRDAVGAIFDYGLDPKSYIYGGQWFAKLNWSALYIQDYINMNDSKKDPYIFVRDTWFIIRRIKIKH